VDVFIVELRDSADVEIFEDESQDEEKDKEEDEEGEE